jgi:hypothetical protein
MEREAIRRTGSWSLQAICRMESSLGSAGWRTLDSVVLSTSTFAICGTAENVLLEHAGPAARCPRVASPRILLSANVLAERAQRPRGWQSCARRTKSAKLCTAALVSAAGGAQSLAVWQTAAAGCLNNVRSASVEGEGLGSRKCLKLDCNLKAVHGARQCTSYPSSARTLQQFAPYLSASQAPRARQLSSRLCVLCGRACPGSIDIIAADRRLRVNTQSRRSPRRPLCHRVLSASEGTRSSSTGVRLRTANLRGHSHRVFP